MTGFRRSIRAAQSSLDLSDVCLSQHKEKLRTAFRPVLKRWKKWVAKLLCFVENILDHRLWSVPNILDPKSCCLKVGACVCLHSGLEPLASHMLWSYFVMSYYFNKGNYLCNSLHAFSPFFFYFGQKNAISGFILILKLRVWRRFH